MFKAGEERDITNMWKGLNPSFTGLFPHNSIVVPTVDTRLLYHQSPLPPVPTILQKKAGHIPTGFII